MDMKLELVAVPVSDVDRAKAFYVDKVGFNADHDFPVSDEMRFVQLTPPGSACSIAIGKGIVEGEPWLGQGPSGGRRQRGCRARGAIGTRRRRQRRPGVPVGPVRVLRGPRRQQVVRPRGPAARLSEKPLLVMRRRSPRSSRRPRPRATPSRGRCGPGRCGGPRRTRGSRRRGRRRSSSSLARRANSTSITGSLRPWAMNTRVCVVAARSGCPALDGRDEARRRRGSRRPRAGRRRARARSSSPSPSRSRRARCERARSRSAPTARRGTRRAAAYAAWNVSGSG